MTKEEIAEVLRKHDIWMDDEDSEEGERANLQGANLHDANLQDADLQDADLRGAYGDKKTIKSMQVEKYNIAYTHDRLFIGCKNYLISEWMEFDDAAIRKMDTGALEWWTKWKEVIFKIIEMSPAT